MPLSQVLSRGELIKCLCGHVGSYVEQANGGKVKKTGIMGSWRKLKGVRADGSRVSLEANVCDLRNEDERYFIAFFKDRTEIEAEIAAAEDGLLRQQRLSGQVTRLRQIFAGTVGLVVMLGFLVVAQWSTGSEGEGLSMIKDVLLVMTGILSSAMASVFDTRNRQE